MEIKTKTNQGTGAGGSSTNKNGLRYEELTSLKSHFTVTECCKFGEKITFDGCKKYHHASKSNLFKYMKDKGHFDKRIHPGHGCKQPDEAFIDEDKKIVFIIEKKFQSVGGSVCEKIQSPHFKAWMFTRQFRKLYKIIYIYCLSDYFTKNCKAEIEYLDTFGWKYFRGSDVDYKNKIIGFIQNQSSI